MTGATQGEVEILENIHTTQQGEGAVVRERDISQMDLMRHGFNHVQ